MTHSPAGCARILALPLGLVIAFLLAACVPPPSTPAAGGTDTAGAHSYTGRVVDAVTAAPVPGAKIALDFQGTPPVVYTDSEGVFRFSLRFNGPTLDGRVRVDAPGYSRYERLITLSATQPAVEDIRLDALVPTPTTAAAAAAVPSGQTLTVQVWDVALDRKHAVVASQRFPAAGSDAAAVDALLEEAGQWIVTKLGIAEPLAEAVTVRMQVPADLSTGPIVITSTPPSQLEVNYYYVTGSGKTRLPLSVSAQALAALDQDFFIEVGLPGYASAAVPVPWGAAVDEEVVLQALGMRVAVEDFRDDPNAIGAALAGYLSRYATVMDPDALEDLRAEIQANQEVLAQNPMIQMDLRTTLDVDYIVGGVWSK